jgi:hypothetical protein
VSGTLSLCRGGAGGKQTQKGDSLSNFDMSDLVQNIYMTYSIPAVISRPNTIIRPPVR